MQIPVVVIAPPQPPFVSDAWVPGGTPIPGPPGVWGVPRVWENGHDVTIQFTDAVDAGVGNPTLTDDGVVRPLDYVYGAGTATWGYVVAGPATVTVGDVVTLSADAGVWMYLGAPNFPVVDHPAINHSSIRAVKFGHRENSQYAVAPSPMRI